VNAPAASASSSISRPSPATRCWISELGSEWRTGWVRTIWIILTEETAPQAGKVHPGREAMTLALYQRVVLTRDIPEEGLRAGADQRPHPSDLTFADRGRAFLRAAPAA